MKRILITGAHSYVGTSVEVWLRNKNPDYIIDTLDMIDDGWRGYSFSAYDVIYHVAGIAHVSTDPKMKSLYYKVNRDLAVETAEKAKNAGVRQFIFMSSGIVYGDSSKIGKPLMITKETIPHPANFYGSSKLEAESGIMSLADYNFNVVILRPPMIYGPGCKGNYNALSRFGRKWLFFPSIKNARSMIFIDNLSEFIDLIIKNGDAGIFHPQNREYFSTTEIVNLIADAHARKIILTKLFNPLIWLMSLFTNKLQKAFGSFTYDLKLSHYKSDYWVCDKFESIKKTEGTF